jgi:uncharacterized integral membrane protein
MICLAAASLLHIDAQKNPLPAIFVAAVIGVLLYFLVGAARRREARRTSRGRDLSGWRSRLPPR